MQKFKIGDRVKLTRPCKEWSGWMDSMNERIGREFTVKSIHSDEQFEDDWIHSGSRYEYLKTGWIRLDDGIPYNYPVDCFDLIEENKMKVFNKGDVVEVIKRVDQENGWNNSWVNCMNLAIGQEYTVDRVDNTSVYFIPDYPEDTIADYGFPPSSLKLIEEFVQEKPKTKMVEFKAGDRVRVVKKVKQQNGWRNGWVSSMDDSIGNEYVINRIDEHGVFFTVGYENSIHGLGFPTNSLELVYQEPVTAKPKIKTEIDPVIKYQYFRGPDYSGMYNGLCLTIATKIKTSKYDNGNTVEWAVSFKHPRDQFNKVLARESVNGKIPKLLFLGKRYSRDEIVAKILADLVYNDQFLSKEYREYVRFLLLNYIGVI
jgi:hypothetical protein